MINKKFFIIGMRRSGTSILRELIMRSPDVLDIEFENHILRFALQCKQIERYKNLKWADGEIDRFKCSGHPDYWYGIKYALNPGVFDMEWIYLHHEFPEAKFIFIIRDKKHTFDSYHKLDKDKKRGAIPWEVYSPFYGFMVGQFFNYISDFPDKTCVIFYRALIENADLELQKVWKFLNIRPGLNCNKSIRIPENWE